MTSVKKIINSYVYTFILIYLKYVIILTLSQKISTLKYIIIDDYPCVRKLSIFIYELMLYIRFFLFLYQTTPLISHFTFSLNTHFPKTNYKIMQTKQNNKRNRIGNYKIYSVKYKNIKLDFFSFFFSKGTFDINYYLICFIALHKKSSLFK